MPTNPAADNWIRPLEDAALWASIRARQETALPDKLISNEYLPYEIIEAVVSLESGFDPDAVNASSGATGLGQILPNGSQELGWYETTFGEDISQDELKNPTTNLRVASFGMIGRWFQVGKGSWFDAAIRYFGCTSRSDSGDGNMTCAEYQDTLIDYVDTWYGSDKVTALNKGEPGRQSISDRVLGETLSDCLLGQVECNFSTLIPYLVTGGAVLVGGLAVILSFVLLVR